MKPINKIDFKMDDFGNNLAAFGQIYIDEFPNPYQENDPEGSNPYFTRLNIAEDIEGYISIPIDKVKKLVHSYENSLGLSEEELKQFLPKELFEAIKPENIQLNIKNGFTTYGRKSLQGFAFEEEALNNNQINPILTTLPIDDYIHITDDRKYNVDPDFIINLNTPPFPKNIETIEKMENGEFSKEQVELYKEIWQNNQNRAIIYYQMVSLDAISAFGFNMRGSVGNISFEQESKFSDDYEGIRTKTFRTENIFNPQGTTLTDKWLEKRTLLSDFNSQSNKEHFDLSPVLKDMFGEEIPPFAEELNRKGPINYTLNRSQEKQNIISNNDLTGYTSKEEIKNSEKRNNDQPSFSL